MQLWHRLTFEQKTIALFAAFILLITLYFIILYFFYTKLENDVEQITSWQKQKLELQATLNNIGNNADLTNKISSIGPAMKRYDHLLGIMLNGGIIPGTKTYFDAAEDEEAILLNDLTNTWAEVYSSLQIALNTSATKDTIVQQIEQVRISDTLDIYTSRIVSNLQTIPNPVRISADEHLELAIPEILASNEEYYGFLIQDHNDKKAMIINTSLIFWIGTIVTLLILLLKIRTDVFAPLTTILNSGDVISKGNRLARIKEPYDHELGKLAGIFNQTAVTMEKATTFINSLGKGEIENAELILDEHNDGNKISAALMAMKLQMQQIEKEEKERNWISDGLTRFADLLRINNESLELLSDKVTSSLVKYTGSLVGGMYLLNDNDELELMAFYAFNTKKYNTRRFKPGEGLVGQTFLEEDYIYLLEIPENYISVATGIGETSPKAILLVPLKVENDVFGVLELASLREYHKYEIDFVKKLSESIASTILNVKINQQTKKLLEESQQMTEQMRSQEEEMRQNMEELSATQEEMSRKELEMTARFEALDSSLAMAEYDPSMHVLHVNKNFVLMHSLTERANLTIRDIVPDSETATDLIDDLWKELLKGSSQHGFFTHKTSQGILFEVESIFTPVKDGKGEVSRIIELARKVDKVNDTPGSDVRPQYLSEIEEELRLNLEALDITQQKLTQQYDDLCNKATVIEGVMLTVETNKSGDIISSSEKFKKVFTEIENSVLEITGIKEDLFLTDTVEGEINYNNNTFNYTMRQINDDSYFFLFTNI